MKSRSLLALAAACTLATGCDGLKEAFSAHTSVAARAGSQELTVTRLGNLLGHASIQIPPTREAASVLAEFWVDYQLLGEAAAKGDSLTTKKEIDAATTSYTASMVLRKMQGVLDSILVPDKASETGYDQAADNVYDVRHILFRFPQGATPAQKDSIRRRAAGVLPQVNDGNFAAMAKKFSGDGSAPQGGSLPPFVVGQGKMIPEFESAVTALKPGQISPLVETQYGYHIIQRLTYAEAKDEYDKSFAEFAANNTERSYVAKLDSDATIQVRSGAPGQAKVAALDPASHRKDESVLATFKGGKLTVSRFLMWLDQFPPSQRIAQQMQSSPDSIVQMFIKNLTTNEVLLQKADSMHVTLSPDEQQAVYHDFAQVVSLSWNALGVDPKSLADSAKTAGERERLASARVEALFDGMMAGTTQPVPIPTPLKALIENKFSWKVNATAIDRATDLARQIRTSADSARAANQPKSQVPLPGAVPPAGTTQTKKP
jgi:PPIC-type PPIASE domain